MRVRKAVKVNSYRLCARSACSGVGKGSRSVSPGLHTAVTESQNHRMVGVGRDLCGSSSPTPQSCCRVGVANISGSDTVLGIRAQHG